MAVIESCSVASWTVLKPFRSLPFLFRYSAMSAAMWMQQCAVCWKENMEGGGGGEHLIRQEEDSVLVYVWERGVWERERERERGEREKERERERKRERGERKRERVRERERGERERKRERERERGERGERERGWNQLNSVSESRWEWTKTTPYWVRVFFVTGYKNCAHSTTLQRLLYTSSVLTILQK